MMAERFSNIAASLRQAGGLYFLFVPLGGLVAYIFLFHATKPSALMIAGPLEKATALFTMVFFAFAVAGVLTFILALGHASKNSLASRIADRAGIILFAALATVLVIVMVENFAYTMFRVGIKNTDSTFAKLLILAATLGVFSFFCKIGPGYRRSICDCRFPIANVIIAVASGFALINLVGNIDARASLDTVFPKNTNILIISSDGINAKRMSLYGYKRKTTPFLDSIRQDTVIARSAFANNGHTTGSITALLTGMLPTRSKVVFPPDSLSNENAYRSLPRLLRKQGYYTNNIAVPHYADAAEQNMLEAFDMNNNRSMVSSSLPIKFNYKTTNWLFDRMLSNTTALVKDVVWLEEMPNPYSQVDGEERGQRPGFNDMQRLQSIMSDFNRTDRPFFINSHLMGTHGPSFSPGVVRFSMGKTAPLGEWSNDHYDDAVLTFDAYVRRIYKRLESKGLLDKTIIVITSDHGISNEARFKIPLIIRFPNKEFGGTVINENVQTVDIAPTLINYLGGSKPAWMEGQSLIGGPVAANRKIFSASVEKILFAPSVGVIAESAGRFGSMDYFYMMHCDTTYKLNLKTSKFEVVPANDPQNMCAAAETLSPADAKQAMLDHLNARYE